MKLLTGILILLIAGTFVLFQVNGLESGMILAASAYSVLITLFLLIIVWGFTKSHISYLKKIEDAKEQVLEVEGILPCKKNQC